MLNNMTTNSNLPFKQDSAYRYVPWIIGLMVFLAILALAGTHMVSSYVKLWDKSFTPGFTVEVPLKINPFNPYDSFENQQSFYIKTLENLSGVESARVIPKSYLSPFADPFSKESKESLFIDVTARSGFELTREKIKSILPADITASIRDHREWRQSAVSSAYTATFIGIIVACIIGLAAVATIAFVASTGLQVHNKTIEILHLVGARHNYIARQFQNYALKLAVRGSNIGFLLVAITAALIVWIMGPPVVLSYLQQTQLIDYALIIFLTPLIGIMLTVLSARLTVLSALAKTKTW